MKTGFTNLSYSRFKSSQKQEDRETLKGKKSGQTVKFLNDNE